MLGPSLPTVVCGRAHVLFVFVCVFSVSDTCCVVYLFYFSSSFVPYVASFSGLSILYCPFGVLLCLLTLY